MLKKANAAKNDEIVSTSDVSNVQEHVSRYLDDRTEAIDFNVSSRLSAARHRAVSSRNRTQQLFGPWMRGASIASVLLLVGVLSQSYFSAIPEQTEVAVTTDVVVVQQDTWIEDIHMLSASDDIEFFESVELLEWMEQNSG